MTILFADDHRYIPVNDRIYSEVGFGAGFWRRYVSQFGDMTVIGRAGTVPAGKRAEDLELSTTAGTTFHLFPDLSSVRGLLVTRLEMRAEMERHVAASDGVIIRLPAELGLEAAHCAHRLGKPVLAEVVACAWDSYWNYGHPAGKVYAPLAVARMRRVIARAPFALYVTDRFLQSRYPSRGRTAAISDVMIAACDPGALARRLDRIERAPAGAPLRLGLIGTLRMRLKGIQTVLAALGAVRDQLPPVTFHVLGAGDAGHWRAEAARAGVGDLVFFEGTLPPGGPVLAWLDTIDVYLQPSLKEGLPRALVEAMSRACPAIGSTIAGIPELLDPQDMIRPGDARRLADLLVRRLTDRAWLKACARRNFEVSRRYEAPRLDARRHAFYEEFAMAARASSSRNPDDDAAGEPLGLREAGL